MWQAMHAWLSFGKVRRELRHVRSVLPGRRTGFKDKKESKNSGRVSLAHSSSGFPENLENRITYI
jgi:hypothetical protein